MVQRRNLFVWMLLVPILVACQPIGLPGKQIAPNAPCRLTAGQPLGDTPTAQEALGSTLQLSQENEPGARLLITGTVYATDCQTPLTGATITFWQADAGGVYDDLEGTLRTDADGRYELYTVKPGYYAGEKNPPPLHIHFRVAHSAARGIESEFLFADDPIYLTLSRDFSTQVVTLEQTSTADGILLRGVFNIVLAAK